MDLSPGTLGEFLQKAFDREIADEEESYARYGTLGLGHVREYRFARMRAIDRLQVAKQILKTLEEHELEFSITLEIEEEVQQKIGRKDSILKKIEHAKKGILRRPRFKVEVTVLVGEVKLKLPEKYWKWTATKGPA